MSTSQGNNSARSAFVEGVSALTVNTILPILADCLLREREVDVTVEEMIQWLEFPLPGPRTPSMSAGGIQLPGAFRTGTTPSRTGSATTSTNTRGGARRKEPDANAPRCVYVFQRGVKKGNLCGDVAVPGTQFCKNCGRKKGVLQGSTGAPGAPTVAAPTRGGKAPQQASQPEVDVVALPNRPGFFKAIESNFIIQQRPDGMVVAVCVEENGEERPLTSSERDHAVSIGFTVSGESQDHPEEDEHPEDDFQSGEDLAPVTIQQTSTPTIPSFSAPAPRPAAAIPTSSFLAPRPSAGPSFKAMPGFKPPSLGKSSVPGLPQLN